MCLLIGVRPVKRFKSLCVQPERSSLMWESQRTVVHKSVSLKRSLAEKIWTKTSLSLAIQELNFFEFVQVAAERNVLRKWLFSNKSPFDLRFENQFGNFGERIWIPNSEGFCSGMASDRKFAAQLLLIATSYESSMTRSSFPDLQIRLFIRLQQFDSEISQTF